ncbi:MAG TPA: hypothetical protein VKA00_07550 [Trueperaceae bacterium]|nr:hypothetical protein [Trueperaceae bacterium]
MARLALFGLGVVVAALLIVALLPQHRRPAPSSTITLDNADVTLYPQADPQAVWTFQSPTVRFDPNLRQTTLLDIQNGKRVVNGKTDFTLASNEIIIDSNDNLRGQHITAHLLSQDVTLDMVARSGRQVLINQQKGQFEVPRVTVTDPNDNNIVFEDMRIGFDFTTFQAGGPGTVGYGTFVVSPPGKEPQ